jgi:hypothetical protein
MANGHTLPNGKWQIAAIQSFIGNRQSIVICHSLIANGGAR